jgi:hypothetical protein
LRFDPLKRRFNNAGAAGLEYKTSTEAATLGDRVPDFSGVGYGHGAALPAEADIGGRSRGP